jgi:crotonobetainyl-CoA:carnitine CoA-transferase CaiB-like acyl-CoA transferase
MAKVLQGLRVIELGTFITGPAAAMHLADLGADVIKVERPGTGDPFRAFKGELYSPHYITYNRNKRSIALDTRDPDDLKVFQKLIKTADVFIQNFRPGVAESLNCGYEQLREINPRLVYAAISGFGRSGPSRDRPAFDTVAQAASGWLRLVTPPEQPRVLGPALADSTTGFYTAFGILGAIYERERTGVGRRIDISMLEAMCHFNLDSYTHYFSEGEIMTPYSRPSVSQSYVFECSDSKWVAIHMSSPVKFWEGLCEAVERPDLLTDPRFAERPARIAHQPELREILAPIFKTRTRDEWCARIEAAGTPYSPAYDSNEALEDPQAQHLGIKATMHHPEKGDMHTVRNPLSFDGEVERDLMAPPTLDEHGPELRKEMESVELD